MTRESKPKETDSLVMIKESRTKQTDSLVMITVPRRLFFATQQRIAITRNVPKETYSLVLRTKETDFLS
jgi:hypothetical protein